MAVEIKVPSVGESVTEATIGRWLKPNGAAVKADEPVVELLAAVQARAPAPPAAAEPPAKPQPAPPPAPARAAEPPPAPAGRETRQRMSAIRQRIAERLLAAQQNAAILTTFNEADLSAV